MIFFNYGNIIFKRPALSICLLFHNCTLSMSLLSGLDACPINRTDGNSLDFTVRRTQNISYNVSINILDCKNYFNSPDLNASLQQRKCKWVRKFATAESSVCRPLRSFAQCELVSPAYM